MNFYTDNPALKFQLSHPLMQKIVSLRERNFSEKEKYDFAPQDFEDAIDNTTTDTNYNKPLANATNTLLSSKIGKYIYIQNNLDYALKLEYGASKQAPQGMVRINVERFAKR